MGKKRKITETSVEPHREFRSWSNLPTEILQITFSKMNQKELLWVISSVCRSWRLACWDVFFWKGEVLDLRILPLLCLITDMDVVRNKFPVFKKRTKELDLVYLMGLALVKVVKSLFDPYGDMFADVSRNCLSLTLPVLLYDEHFVCVAERVPKLQSMSLCMKWITGKGFSKAVRNLTELESVSMAFIRDSHYTHVIQELGINCRKLEVLKICLTDTPFPLDEYNSRVMADNLLSLKVLYLIGCVICKLGLQTIMSKSRQLEDISLCSCSRALEDVKVTRRRRALEAKHNTFTPGTLSLLISMDVNCNWWCVDTLPGNYDIMTVINHIWEQTGDVSGGLEDDSQVCK